MMKNKNDSIPVDLSTENLIVYFVKNNNDSICMFQAYPIFHEKKSAGKVATKSDPYTPPIPKKM